MCGARKAAAGNQKARAPCRGPRPIEPEHQPACGGGWGAHGKLGVLKESLFCLFLNSSYHSVCEAERKAPFKRYWQQRKVNIKNRTEVLSLSPTGIAQ